MTQTVEHIQEEKLRWKAGAKDILATSDSREVMHSILEEHGLWDTFPGSNGLQREEAIGAHNAGIAMLNTLRTRAPELVALMITEAAEREARDHERSSRATDERGDGDGDTGSRGSRPRFEPVRSK